MLTIKRRVDGGNNKQFMCIAFDTLDKISYESIIMLKCTNKLSKWVSNTFMSITFIYIIYETMLTILTLSPTNTFIKTLLNHHYNDLKSNNTEVVD